MTILDGKTLSQEIREEIRLRIDKRKAEGKSIPCLATMSAPTTLALSMARDAGMVLACRSPDGVVRFVPEA